MTNATREIRLKPTEGARSQQGKMLSREARFDKSAQPAL